MKKRIFALLVGVICVTSVVVGAAAENTAREYHRFRTERRIYRQLKHKDVAKDTNITKKAAPEKPSLIAEEEAKSKALERAGMTADAVKRIKAELDYEKGVWEYEVEFKHAGFEYEVDINAATGEVIKFEKEFDD